MHLGQRKVLQDNSRFKVLACGRRWGKTLLGACMCLETGLQGGVVWWVAPDFPRAKIAWRILLKLVSQIPYTKVLKGELMIILPGGGTIQLKSTSNPDSLRGEGLHLVVIDECADTPEEAWIDALRPALSDYRGAALFIGTPKGRNWFHGLFERAKGLDNWAAFQMPTSTNPHIARQELRDAQAELPKRTWDQEYCAKFVTFEGRVYELFDPAGPWVFSDFDKSIYSEFFGGIDFGFRNPTSMSIGGEREDGKIDIVDEVYERRLMNSEVVDLALEMQEKYDIRCWWADQENPEMIAELTNAGLPVQGAPRTSGGQESVVQWQVRLVDGLFQERRDGKPDPALRILDTCEMHIKEHDNYRYPKISRVDSEEKEKPLKKDDHTCFPPGTMISTPAGQSPIETLLPGDSLLTHRGIGRILAIAQTGVESLVRVATSCGRWLICTPDHPVAVRGGGFVAANDLLGMEVDVWQTQKQLNMGGIPGGDIPNHLTIRSGRISEGQPEKGPGNSSTCGFTSRFSRIMSAESCRGCTFITATAMRGTIGRRTFNSLRRRNTRNTIASSCAQRLGKDVRIGIDHPKAENGTARTASKRCKIVKKLNTPAFNVAKPGNQKRGTANSVRQTVKRNSGGHLASITRTGHVLSAIMDSSVTATTRRKLARVGVEPSLVIAVEKIEGAWPVINLATTDGTYFANGVLTSNCNSVQYMIHGLSEWYGWDAGGAMAAGGRAADSLPK